MKNEATVFHSCCDVDGKTLPTCAMCANCGWFDIRNYMCKFVFNKHHVEDPINDICSYWEDGDLKFQNKEN